MSAGSASAGEQRLEDLAVQPAARGGWGRSSGSRGAPARGGSGRGSVSTAAAAGARAPSPAAGPARHHGVEQRRCWCGTARPTPARPAGATSSSRRDARPTHRVRDRRRQRGGGARRQQLGDVERVAAGGGVDARRHRRPPATRRRPADSGASSMKSLESSARMAPTVAVQPVAGRRLAGAERQHQQRRQRGDAPAEHRDRVERRVVGPVHVLEHEHRRDAAASSSSAISSAWMSCGAAPRSERVARAAARPRPARSRIGPSGRGMERSSQVPDAARAPSSPRSRRNRSRARSCRCRARR